MDTQTHDTELQELFKGETLSIAHNKGLEPITKVNIKRELSRLELGHCFSLGLTAVKRSGEGLSLTFNRSLASINTIYQNLANG